MTIQPALATKPRYAEALSTSIYFLDAEPNDRAFFERELSGQTVHFVKRPDQVGPDATVLSLFIHTPLDERFLDRHPALKMVATRSTGTTHIDLPACRERGVAVANVPSYGEHTVAEHTFALILTLSRRLREVMRIPGKEDRVAYESLRAFELRDKTLGVVGAGRIGRHVIRMARAFGMNVLAHDTRREAACVGLPDAGCVYAPLEQVLAEAHVLTLHVPLRADTHHLLNAKTLAICRRGVVVINTARGGLIDTNALLDALDSGQVGGAGLDVLEEDSVIRQEATRAISEQIIQRLHAITNDTEPHGQDPARVKEFEGLLRNKRLLARPDVIFTPHIGFNSIEAVERINAATVENIRRFLRGETCGVIERRR